MGSILKIVPVDEFDLPYFAAAVKNVEQFEIDGEVIPSDEALANDRKAITTLKKGLAALSPAQKRTSRWATHAELAKAVKAAGKAHGFTVDGDGRGNDWQMTLERDGDEPGVLESSLIINASTRTQDSDEYETFYCTGSEDAFQALASELAKLAGPQVTFAAEDYSWADVTQLHLGAATKPAKKKPVAKQKPVAKKKSVAKKKPTKKKGARR